MFLCNRNIHIYYLFKIRSLKYTINDLYTLRFVVKDGQWAFFTFIVIQNFSIHQKMTSLAELVIN